MMNYGPQRPFIQRIASHLRSVAKHWLLLLIMALVVFVLVALIIVICGYLYEWRWTGVLKKTFYDWLELLIVPVVLGIGGYVVARAVTQSEQRIAAQQAQEAQREASLNQTVQTYLTEMSQLLLDKEQPLRIAQPGDNISMVARARTLSVLQNLDGSRKRTVLQFLYDTDLITKDKPVFSLQRADLNKVSLYGVNLSTADLSSASLKESDLRNAYVGNGASLNGALLGQPDGGPIEAVDLETGQSKQLGSATMPDGRKFEEWLKDLEGHEEDRENSGPS